MMKAAINLAKLTYWDSFIPKSSVKIAATSIISAFILGSGYVLNRPCIFGGCPEITQAQQLADSAAVAAITSPAEPTIIKVRQQLEKSRAILQAIPWWSKFHRQAATLLQENHTKFYELDLIEAAIEIAEVAKLTTNKLPLTTVQWQEVCQLWQDAIALLDKIPQTSIFQTSAKIYKQESQINLVKSQHHLAQERQAQTNLKAAEEVAKLAKLGEDGAQSPTDWQSVRTNWQSAILSLQKIAPQTTTYRRSRQLLGLYITQSIRAVTKERQEASAVSIYNQAVQQAKLAKAAESKNQWQQAVSHWRSALNAIRQVPKNSFRADRTEPLAILYTLSLKQSEKKLDREMQQQKTNNELKKICHNSVEICNYYITENTIKIILKSNYIQQIRNTSLTAQTQGNSQIQIEILNHLAQLEKNLQLISKNTKKRVELYNTNGGLMALYKF